MKFRPGPRWSHQYARLLDVLSQREVALKEAERVVVDAPELQVWAQRVAATLPPLTADEAESVGRLAAVLDARRGPNVGAKAAAAAVRARRRLGGRP